MKNSAAEYVKNQILTSTREQLLLLLFDGAIRFAGQARARIEEKDVEGSCRLLIRAQRVVLELKTSLRRELVGDEIFAAVSGLYNFVHSRLVAANVKRDPALIDEAVRILSHLRETWALAAEKDRREKFPEIALLEEAQRAHDARPPGAVNVKG
jgi:flagellar protein FliS